MKGHKYWQNLIIFPFVNLKFDLNYSALARPLKTFSEKVSDRLILNICFEVFNRFSVFMH